MKKNKLDKLVVKLKERNISYKQVSKFIGDYICKNITQKYHNNTLYLIAPKNTDVFKAVEDKFLNV